ncbi:MAG: hypothetical protein U0793_19105 [Gemmataceae bacterium]
MATLAIKETVWQSLVAAARKRRTRPEILAEKAVTDFLRRAADEELLAQSERAAQKTGLSASDAERLVRQFRSKGKR